MNVLDCSCGHAEHNHEDCLNLCLVYGCFCEEFILKDDEEKDDFSDSGSELNK